MIRRTRRIAVFVVLSISLLIALALSVPHMVHWAVRNTLDAHQEIRATGIRVRPNLAIEVSDLHVDTGPIQLHCTDARIHPSLHPAAVFGRKAKRLTRVEIRACAGVAKVPAPDTASTVDDEEADAARTNDRHRHPVHANVDALYNTLRTRLRIVESLHIHHADLRMTQGTHHIEGQLHDIRWRDHDGAPHLWFDVSLSKDIHAESLAVDLKFNDADSTLNITTDAPVRIKNQALHIERAELRDARELHIPAMTIHAPTEWLQTVSLHNIDLHLDTTPQLGIERAHIALAGVDLASVILQRDVPNDASETLPVEHGAENGGETDVDSGQNDRRAAQDVWSLRTLQRARTSVARLYELFESDATRWPLSFDIRDVAIVHDAQALMEIATLRGSETVPLFLDARIGDAHVELRAVPSELGHWTLQLKNASLRRMAMFLELEEHLSGRTDADIHLVLRNATLDAQGKVSIRHAVLDHPKVSEMRVGPMNMQGEFLAQLPADSMQAASLSAAFSFNGIPLAFELSALPVHSHTRFVSSLKLSESTACQSIWDGVPAGLVPELGHSAVTFRGSMQPALSLNYIGGAFDTFELRSEGFPGDCTLRIDSPHWNPQELTQADYVHHVQEGVTRDDIFVGPGTEDYVALHDLPTYVPAVMYLSEEIAFYTNGALSLGLINRGIRHILPRRRFAYGGSTVTQQLVKNLYLTRTKTLSRKFQEAIIAWSVTEEVDKDRVLELYLNCIEFGPNLYGIVRAARYYFDKEPSDLTALEAAWLASLKPSPRRGEREFQRGYSDFENWNSRRIETLLKRLVQYGEHISDEEIDAAAPFVVYFPTSPNAGSRPPGLPLPEEKTVTSDEYTDNEK